MKLLLKNAQNVKEALADIFEHLYKCFVTEITAKSKSKQAITLDGGFQKKKDVVNVFWYF